MTFLDDPRIETMMREAAFWLKIAAPLIIIILLFVFAYQAMVTVLTPFVAAFILAYILDPGVTLIEKRLRISRVFAVTLIYLVFLLLLAVFFSIVGAQIVSEIGTFFSNFQNIYWPRISLWATQTFSVMIENIPEDRKQELLLMWEEILASVSWDNLQQTWSRVEELAEQERVREGAGFVARAVGAVVVGIGTAVAAVFRGVTSFVLNSVSVITVIVFALIITFYILIGFSTLKQRIVELYPKIYKDDIVRIVKKIDVQLSSYLRGQLTIAILVGILSSVGLLLIGVPYAVIIGMFAGMANLIPYLGPVVGATPAILVTILEHYPDWGGDILWRSLAIVGLFVIIQTLDGFVISPKVMGDALNLNPMIIMFALLLGGALMGLLGMLLAIPVLCVVRVLINELYLFRQQAGTPEPADGKT